MTNDLNKIFIDDNISIEKINMNTWVFADDLLISKTQYNITKNALNLIECANTNLSAYININSTKYFEYKISLRSEQTAIRGLDKFKNSLVLKKSETYLVFVNGKKLYPYEYLFDFANNTIYIQKKVSNYIFSNVTIISSENITYKEQVTQDPSWDVKTHSFICTGYTKEKYIFFKNGMYISPKNITKMNDYVFLNVSIQPDIDIIEYYIIPSDTISYVFDAQPGYLTYGPTDSNDKEIIDLYDTIIHFASHISRLSIDNLRPGFFIKEANNDGTAIVIPQDFESYSLKCIEMEKFSKSEYSTGEFFAQVPDARSILNYISEFDFNGALLPELLSTFQTLLLNETYDSIKRLQNIRNIYKVDSKNINTLINFLGLKLNITNMTLEQKHALLEELNSFYKRVGTKDSYDFYNLVTKNSKIIKMEQLFTPIKDISSGASSLQRYITFRSPEDLGAQSKREYVYPVTDYGYISAIANSGDTLYNDPHSEGELENPNLPPILNTTRYTQVINDEGKSQLKRIPVSSNLYTVAPIAGKNTPTIDYNVIDEEATNIIDYNLVSDPIIGQWIEWMEWDRPKNWYPTNHVNVALEVPAEIDYNTFMSEFKNSFYDIASAVLYIHSIIEVYTFGNDKRVAPDDHADSTFNIMTSQLYHDLEYVFTNDPARQY